jgi:hypothetical protein
MERGTPVGLVAGEKFCKHDLRRVRRRRPQRAD